MGKKSHSSASFSALEQKILSLEKMLKESESLRKLEIKKNDTLETALKCQNKNHSIYKKTILSKHSQEMKTKEEEINSLKILINQQKEKINSQTDVISTLQSTVKRNNYINTEIFLEKKAEEKERISTILKGEIYEAQPHFQFIHRKQDEESISKQKADIFDKMSEEIISFCKHNGEKIQKGISYYIKKDQEHNLETPLLVMKEIFGVVDLETTSNSGLLGRIKNFENQIKYTEIHFKNEIRKREERIKILETERYLNEISTVPFPKMEQNIEEIKTLEHYYKTKEIALENEIQERLIEERHLKTLFSKYLKEIKSVNSLVEMNDKILEIYKRFNSVYIPDLEMEIAAKKLLKIQQNLTKMSKEKILEEINGTSLEIYGEELFLQRKQMIYGYEKEIYV